MQFTAVLSRFGKWPGFHTSIGMYRMVYNKHQPQMCQLRYQWKQKYVPVLTTNNTISEETWEDMRKYVMKSNSNPTTTDTIILQILKDENYLDAGISYYKFLESNKYDLSVSIVCRYMELCTIKKGPLSTAEKEHIFSLCNDIMSKYATYDKYTSTILINTLCKIDKWKEAVKVIETFEAYDNIALWQGYGYLLTYFFRNGYVELGYKYLADTLVRGMSLSLEYYNAHIEYCLKEKDTFNEKIEKLFNMWCTYGVKPTQEILLAYIEVCNQAGWSAQFALISNMRCNICKQKLREVDITDEEYDKLRKEIMEKLIFDKMYDVTDPAEIKHFVQFIERSKPYDIIIDGLNVIYLNNRNDNLLRKLLRHYKGQGKKVLVIGKQHIRKQLEREPFPNLANYFYVDNMSKDDAFLLYAAFSSGKGTKIISNDVMRNHKFHIQNAELKTIFKKWQIVHQYSSLDQTTGIKKLSWDTPIDAVVRKDNNCWHIPYIKHHTKMEMRHTCDTNWVCLNMCP